MSFTEQGAPWYENPLQAIITTCLTRSYPAGVLYKLILITAVKQQ